MAIRIAVFFCLLFCVYAAPDFSMQGFATQNGGTTGGAGGTKVTAKTLDELKAALESKDTVIVELATKISALPNGDVIKINRPNKSLIGVGSGAYLEGVGLYVMKTNNVIIRNVKVSLVGVNLTHTNDEKRQQITVNDGDAMRIVDSHNVWVDHCEFWAEDPAKQPNQDYYDGLIDITHECQYITISWNYFHDHHKANLIGASDSDLTDRKTTFHHNYYRNIEQRTPSYRGGIGHVYNSLFDHITGTGVNSRVGACVLIENNDFETAKDPVIQTGGGHWKLAGNLFNNITGLAVPASDCNPTIPYKYTLDAASTVAATVKANAGVGHI